MAHTDTKTPINLRLPPRARRALRRAHDRGLVDRAYVESVAAPVSVVRRLADLLADPIRKVRALIA